MFNQNAKTKTVKINYMAQLDAWTDAEVIGVIFQASKAWYEGGNEAPYRTAAEQVRKAIRAKMLESYRNGQATAPKAVK